MLKKISFSSIKYSQIEDIVDITKKIDDSQFDEWFSYPFVPSEEELDFLKMLIRKNRLRIEIYSEEDLKAKFLIPLLNRVDFNINDKITDWYEPTIKTIINDYELGGVSDFLVAKGYAEPKIPYFFIQEFKPSFSASSPETQLLAELLVALHLNKAEKMSGAYIAGSFWKFMILEKVPQNKFIFYVSENFDALKMEDLTAIYKHLQAVKASLPQ